MKTSRFTLVSLAIALLLLASPVLVQVTTSQGMYDPWCDQDSDGDVDIYDIVPAAAAYGTTGDPTKNVNVTNWPVSDQVTVFYAIDHSAGALYSGLSGFSQMHLSWRVTDLADTESVTIQVSGYIYNQEHTVGSPYLDREIIATPSKSEGSTTFPLPSPDGVYFSVSFASGTTGYVTLAFYLFA
jgi:hypothetical protein